VRGLGLLALSSLCVLATSLFSLATNSVVKVKPPPVCPAVFIESVRVYVVCVAVPQSYFPILPILNSLTCACIFVLTEYQKLMRETLFWTGDQCALEEWASPLSPCPAVTIDIVRVCVMCVTVLELPGRKRWSNRWHLHALWSRFLSHSPVHSPVHQTQHVHDSHMPMIRWCFAGKYSPISGLTACVDCRAGKFQPYAGAESVCVRGRGGGRGWERKRTRPRDVYIHAYPCTQSQPYP